MLKIKVVNIFRKYAKQNKAFYPLFNYKKELHIFTQKIVLNHYVFVDKFAMRPQFFFVLCLSNCAYHETSSLFTCGKSVFVLPTIFVMMISQF